MFLVKQCAHEGCNGIAAFGHGLPSRGEMKWACSAHRDLIRTAVLLRAAKEGGPGTSIPHADPRPPSSIQARLL